MTATEHQATTVECCLELNLSHEQETMMDDKADTGRDSEKKSDHKPAIGEHLAPQTTAATRPVTVVTQGMPPNPRYSFIPIRTEDESQFPASAASSAAAPEVLPFPPGPVRQTQAAQVHSVRLQPRYTRLADTLVSESWARPTQEADSAEQPEAKRHHPAVKDKAIEGQTGTLPAAAANQAAPAQVRSEILQLTHDDLVTPPPFADSDSGSRGLNKRNRDDRNPRGTP